MTPEFCFIPLELTADRIAQTPAPNLPGIRIGARITIFSCSGPAAIWRHWFLKPYCATYGPAIRLRPKTVASKS
jgi:hypothetical protein